MKRRCNFLDCLPAFNYNTGSGEYVIDEIQKKVTGVTDTTHLGSTLMHTMLSEVSDFCDPSIKENWSIKAHQQVSGYVTNNYFSCSKMNQILGIVNA